LTNIFLNTNKLLIHLYFYKNTFKDKSVHINIRFQN
jgi:hypothetical protein